MLRSFLAMLFVLVLGCENGSSGTTSNESSEGGEGETVVTVEQVDPESEQTSETEGETEAPAAEGRVCHAQDDCPQGQLCAGPEGCGGAWTCQPARPCTRDLVTYCTCDGDTVQGSGSCPPEPYEHRGPC